MLTRYGGGLYTLGGWWCFFFFSSRRRHTRYWRDWSSDVCSSDLAAALTAGARGCEVVFHAAAHVEEWGDPKVFHRINVLGTRRVIGAARQAGARRVVHVGTEAALLAGQPLVAVDESYPLRPDSPAPYSRTKALAEIEVLTAAPGIEVVVVRPRFVWGRGDTTLLPVLVEQVRAGGFAWVGGG